MRQDTLDDINMPKEEVMKHNNGYVANDSAEDVKMSL
jgi:hypothetical protein